MLVGARRALRPRETAGPTRLMRAVGPATRPRMLLHSALRSVTAATLVPPPAASLCSAARRTRSAMRRTRSAAPAVTNRRPHPRPASAARSAFQVCRTSSCSWPCRDTSAASMPTQGCTPSSEGSSLIATLVLPVCPTASSIVGILGPAHRLPHTRLPVIQIP